MFLGAYGSGAVIVLGSVLLGYAVCTACGGTAARWWAAPAVGLASLIVLTGAAIKLPGHATTAGVVTLIVLAGAAGLIVRRGLPRVRLLDSVVVVLPLIAASLPFIASGRIGLPGVSLDNDTDLHLLWAEGLRSSQMAKLWHPANGYPLGPHSLVATVGSALGSSLDLVFTGLELAVVAIVALVAAGLLANSSLLKRILVALLCSLPYLVAAYYGEGAFKETIMAALLLAFVVHMEQVQSLWAEAGWSRRWRVLIPALLLAAGAFYTYSYVGLAWFGLALGLWAIAGLVRNPGAVRRWTAWSRWRAAIPGGLGIVVLGGIIVAPVAGQTLSFYSSVGTSPSGGGAIPATALGNLIGKLSPYEMFGIWTSTDFRRLPANVFHAGEFAAFALAVALFGVLWSLRHRKLLLPAAAGAAVLIWWRADRTQSPYVSAKALVIAAPLIMALAVRGLLAARVQSFWGQAVRLALAAVFTGLAAYSSYQVLRNEPVQAPEAARELASFQRTIGSSTVLFLGDDDFAPWQLRPAAVSALSPNTPRLNPPAARPNKPYVAAQPLDFDSIDPPDLDHYRYVITTSTPYASQAPANFRLVASEPMYALWQRTGPTIPRLVIEPPGAPGAVLDCRSAAGRRLQRASGEASITTRPVLLSGPAFAAGGSGAAQLPLPTGQWEVSVQYVSSFDVRIAAQGKNWTMPAYLGRVGPVFPVGSVTGRGAGAPVTMTFHSARPSSITGTGDLLYSAFPVIAATRIPQAQRIVPLREACGQYVDWYRLT